ncbi:hypothetical protein FMLHJGGC_00075 [Staphylococcus phage BSwM-KMM1]|nr:hypothetical protein FMLHJGGC_00075 [Pseudomonas phage BSwM KMM1]
MENGYKILTSYNTIVSEIDENNNIVFVNYHSQTTAKHINEFLMQNGHNKMTKKKLKTFK